MAKHIEHRMKLKLRELGYCCNFMIYSLCHPKNVSGFSGWRKKWHRYATPMRHIYVGIYDICNIYMYIYEKYINTDTFKSSQADRIVYRMLGLLVDLLGKRASFLWDW